MGVEYVRILTDDDSILIGIGDFNDFRGKFIIEEVYGNELVVSELSEWTRKG